MLETAKNFASIWERREQENLTKDRNLRLTMADQDKDYNENWLAKFSQEEEDHVGDHINLIMNPSVSQEQVGEPGAENSRSATPINNHPYASMDDEQKDFYAKSMKLRF